MKTLFKVAFLAVAFFVILPDITKARRWQKRWGTPIDKGNHPAKIPTGVLTQARYSSEYDQVRTYEL